MRTRESENLSGLLGLRKRFLERRVVVADEAVERSRRPSEQVGLRARRDKFTHEFALVGRRRARCITLLIPFLTGFVIQAAAENTVDLSSESLTSTEHFDRCMHGDGKRTCVLTFNDQCAPRHAFKRNLELIAAQARFSQSRYGIIARTKN